MADWGGHNKQIIAISANGMKHLLAHVPDQELARSGEFEVVANSDNLWMRLLKPTPELAWVFRKLSGFRAKGWRSHQTHWYDWHLGRRQTDGEACVQGVVGFAKPATPNTSDVKGLGVVGSLKPATPSGHVGGAKPLRHKGSGAWKGVLVGG